MITDGGGYTMYACTGCVAVNMQPPAMNNSCSELGMALVIPRTKAHWQSLFDFVNITLDASLYVYFRAVTGIVKSSDFYASCQLPGRENSIMNSEYCSKTPNGWRATDGGGWWLRDSTYPEPQGDYFANCFLGMDWSTGSNNVSDLHFFDASCGPWTGKYYIW